MTAPASVEIVDRNRQNWRQAVALQKAIAYIGSGPGVDVPLESRAGSQIDPRHIQLLPGPAGRYRVVNLGRGEVFVSGRSLLQYSVAELAPGGSLQIGDYTLTLLGAAPNGQTPPLADAGPRPAGTRSIQLHLNLSETEITVARPLEGSVTVRNAGDQASVQFRLDVLGWPPDCVEIGPGPLLFPGAEKEVGFRLYHPRSSRYRAGEHAVVVRATAPAAYPAEAAEVTLRPRLAAYYNHVLRVTVPAGNGSTTARGPRSS